MDAIRLMLLSLLIGATVSTGPTYDTNGLTIEEMNAYVQPTPVVVQQVLSQPAAATPTPVMVTVAPATPLPATPPPATPPPVAAATAKPVQQTINTGTSITRELYRGTQGDDVRMLQRLLKDLDYAVGVDGTFGEKTQNAVKAFQRNNGLKVDGIAGARTIRKLVSDSAVGASGKKPGDRTTLSYGMSGQDVLDLQYRLTALGYYYDVCSGNYLTNTKAAVQWFQQANGLQVDGMAGPATLTRVYSSSAVAANKIPPSNPTQPPQNGVFYRTLSQGMSGEDVTYLQQLLNRYGYLHSNATGFFGTDTFNAVVAFQARNGLYADGIAGTATQQLLTSGGAVSAGSGGWNDVGYGQDANQQYLQDQVPVMEGYP